MLFQLKRKLKNPILLYCYIYLFGTTYIPIGRRHSISSWFRPDNCSRSISTGWSRTGRSFLFSSAIAPFLSCIFVSFYCCRWGDCCCEHGKLDTTARSVKPNSGAKPSSEDLAWSHYHTKTITRPLYTEVRGLPIVTNSNKRKPPSIQRLFFSCLGVAPLPLPFFYPLFLGLYRWPRVCFLRLDQLSRLAHSLLGGGWGGGGGRTETHSMVSWHSSLCAIPLGIDDMWPGWPQSLLFMIL